MAETPRRLRRVSGETGMISPGIAGAGTDFAGRERTLRKLQSGMRHPYRTERTGPPVRFDA